MEKLHVELDSLKLTLLKTENTVKQEFVVMEKDYVKYHFQSIAEILKEHSVNGVYQNQEIAEKDFVVTHTKKNCKFTGKRICKRSKVTVCKWRFFNTKNNQLCRRRSCCKGRKCSYVTKKNLYHTNSWI